MAATVYMLLKALAVPPGLQGALGLAGLLLLTHRRRLGIALLAFSTLSIALLGMPLVASWLARPLEAEPPFELAVLAGRKVDAIVVLGGGGNEHVREWHGADDVAWLTLQRIRYGARLHALTGLPLAVTGGSSASLRTPEGELMARVLETEFGVPVPYRETESRNTAENAQMTRARFGFDTVVLVTHAVHMPRARRAFEDAGMTVIPAPMGYVANASGRIVLHDLLPTTKGFVYSQYAIYERFGALWYALTY